MRKTALAAIAILLAGSGQPAASDRSERERPARVREARPALLAHEPIVIGTIQYDTGINAGFHPDGMNGSNNNRVVGNRFNTNLGAPLPFTNRVFTLTIFPANSGLQSFTIASGPNSMGSAMVLDYFAANLMANQFNMIPLDPWVHAGPEFLGLFLGTFGGYQPAGLVGMSDMSFLGQGFHAIQGFYVGGPARITGLVPVPNRNAMIRAPIDVFPVELMDFRLE